MVQEKAAAAKDKAAEETETNQVCCMSPIMLAAEPGPTAAKPVKNAEHTFS
jgi:hypothetical protein